MTIRPLGGYIGPTDDIVRWRFGNTWFVTADDPDYTSASNWRRARFVPDEDDPPGEWRNRSEEAPEGGFEGPPCGNISWWDGEGKNVLTWQGPFGRSAPSIGTGNPGFDYYAVPTPSTDLFGTTLRVRWQSYVWDGNQRIATPGPVIGACKRNGAVIIITADVIASPASPVVLRLYSHGSGGWTFIGSHSYTDAAYPTNIATCNRAGTQARLIVYTGADGIAAETVTGSDVSARELAINLQTAAVTTGRAFDAATHPRIVTGDSGAPEFEIFNQGCGRELLAVDWDDDDTRMDVWLVYNLHRDDLNNVFNEQIYLEWVGGTHDGVRVWVKWLDSAATTSEEWEGISGQGACDYLDVRTGTLLMRGLTDSAFPQMDIWLWHHDGDFLLQLHADEVGSLKPLPTTTPWFATCPLGGGDQYLAVDALIFRTELRDPAATSPAGDVVASANHDGDEFQRITNAASADDPGPEFGLAPGASVNPIRFGYRK